MLQRRSAAARCQRPFDTTFVPGPTGVNGEIRALALQPDGRILMGGWFGNVNGTNRDRIARLNADGSLDLSFDAALGPNGNVFALALQPDGRILVGGSFNGFNGSMRRGVARSNSDGSLDTTFMNGMTGTFGQVDALLVRPSGRVLMGGLFASVNDIARHNLAQLNDDGSLDATFLNGPTGSDGDIQSVAVQPDGRLLIGGWFSVVNGTAIDRVARLHGSEPVAPAITAGPSSALSYVGCCAVFRVSTTGTPLDYRWRKDGMELEDGAGVSGAHASTLTLTGVTPVDDGAYSVVVSNALGAMTSSNAMLTVAAVPACKVATCDASLGCVLADVAPAMPINNSVQVTKTPGTAAITWSDPSGSYDVYRGSESGGTWSYNHTCLAANLAVNSTTDSDVPLPSQLFYYVVSRAASCGESSLGTTGAGMEQPNTNACAPLP